MKDVELSRVVAAATPDEDGATHAMAAKNLKGVKAWERQGNK